jgi:twitching motility protein PilT
MGGVLTTYLVRTKVLARRCSFRVREDILGVRRLAALRVATHLRSSALEKESTMLDWLKGGMKKEAALQKLAAAAWADETEKQSLLGFVASDANVTCTELVPLLLVDDVAVVQRVTGLVATRADVPGLGLIVVELADVRARRPVLLGVLGRVKPELVLAAIEAALADGRKSGPIWDLALALPDALVGPLLMRAVAEAPALARAAALAKLVAAKGAHAMRPHLLEAATVTWANVRREALRALGTLDGEDVGQVMMEALSSDDDVENRELAGAYLRRVVFAASPEARPKMLGKLLLGGTPQTQRQILHALASSKDRDQLLVEVLGFCKTQFGAPHARLVGALSTLGEAAVNAALHAAREADPELRAEALSIFGEVKGATSLQACVAMLADTDWWVRVLACDAIGRMKDERAVPHLQRMLQDPDARFAAIDALGAIGGTAVPVLAQLARAQEADVRLAAVGALGGTPPGSKGITEILAASAEHDPSLANRARAVELLRERTVARAAGAGFGAGAKGLLTGALDQLLAYARKIGASDLHLSPGEPPLFRVDGALLRFDGPSLTAGQVTALVDAAVSPRERPQLARTGAADFSYTVPGTGRYRANVYATRKGRSAAFRVVPNAAPQLEALGLPDTLRKVCELHQGIVLVTGPAGSGKSTTLAALVNLLNEGRNAHILSLEQPIEFVHPCRKALVSQREIGVDSVSYAAAMRGALREDPDVIVVGDLRDPATIRLALLAAETGHLVIASMQTTGTVGTLDKIVESFPPDEQAQVRVALAGSLKLVCSQYLVPKVGGGRVPVLEVLKLTAAVRTILREGRTFQIPSMMAVGRNDGMVLADASLEALVADGTVSAETAWDHAVKKEAFAAGAPKPGAPAATVAPPVLSDAELAAALRGVSVDGPARVTAAPLARPQTPLAGIPLAAVALTKMPSVAPPSPASSPGAAAASLPPVDLEPIPVPDEGASERISGTVPVAHPPAIDDALKAFLEEVS